MAKKLSFYNADVLAISTANSIRYYCVAASAVNDELNKAIRAESKTIADFKVRYEKILEENPENLSVDKLAECLEGITGNIKNHEAKKTALEDKRAHLNKFLRVKLWGDKKTGEVGLYHNLLVTGDGTTMFSAYEKFHETYKVDEFRTAIKGMCTDTFGIKGGKNALYSSLINRLEHACGLKATTGAKYRKGQETDTHNERAFTELFFRTLHEYLVNNSGGKVINYTTELYDVAVEWDEGNHVVELKLIER